MTEVDTSPPSSGPIATGEHVVSLIVPALAEYVCVARLTAATLAAKSEFDFDAIEDLRIAIGEVCTVLLDGTGVLDDGPSGTRPSIRFTFTASVDSITVAAELEPAVGVSAEADDLELASQILTAVTAEHHLDLEAGRATLTARRTAG